MEAKKCKVQTYILARTPTVIAIVIAGLFLCVVCLPQTKCLLIDIGKVKQEALHTPKEEGGEDLLLHKMLKCYYHRFSQPEIVSCNQELKSNIGLHKMFHVSQSNGKNYLLIWSGHMAVLSGRYSQFLRFLIRRDFSLLICNERKVSLAYAENP